MLTGSWTLVGHNNREYGKVVWSCCWAKTSDRRENKKNKKKKKKKKKVKLIKVFVIRLYINKLRKNDFWVFVLVDNLLILYGCVTRI